MAVEAAPSHGVVDADREPQDGSDESAADSAKHGIGRTGSANVREPKDDLRRQDHPRDQGMRQVIAQRGSQRRQEGAHAQENRDGQGSRNGPDPAHILEFFHRFINLLHDGLHNTIVESRVEAFNTIAARRWLLRDAAVAPLTTLPLHAALLDFVKVLTLVPVEIGRPEASGMRKINYERRQFGHVDGDVPRPAVEYVAAGFAVGR